ncbi:hypothetical protein ACFLW2_04520, partial [Chloroflexota bacterium]
KIYSLSPSDSCILRANFESLWPKAGEHPTRIPPPKTNQTSVVIWVEIGSQNILLGADLESNGDPSIGWTVILDNQMVMSGRASIIKVPHHGAKSAHEPRIWSELLHQDPISLLTPFTLGNINLPTAEDTQRLNELTSKAYITSLPSRRKLHKFRNRMVKELGGDTYDIFHGWGHVRVRKSIINQSAPSEIILFGDAIHLRHMTSDN